MSTPALTARFTESSTCSEGLTSFSILSHIWSALHHGTPFTLNNDGIAQRDFIHVADVARIVMTLLPMALPEVHINVGTGSATRISDIVAAVQRLQPQLRIERGSVSEAEYSRADTSRLASTLGQLRFIDVMDFVEQAFDARAQDL